MKEELGIWLHVWGASEQLQGDPFYPGIPGFLGDEPLPISHTLPPPELLLEFISAGQGLPNALELRNPGFQSRRCVSAHPWGWKNLFSAAGWVKPILGGIFSTPPIHVH